MSIISGISQNTQGKPLEARLPINNMQNSSALVLPNAIEPSDNKITFKKSELASLERQRLENLGFAGRLKERTLTAALSLSCNAAELAAILTVSAYTLGLGLVSEKVREHQISQLERIRNFFDKYSPERSIQSGTNSIFGDSLVSTLGNSVKHGLTLASYPTSLLINTSLGGLSTAFEEIDRQKFKGNISYSAYLKNIEENPSDIRDALNCITFLGITCLTFGKTKFPIGIALRSNRILSSLGMGSIGALGEQMMRVGDEEKGGFRTRVLISDALNGALSSSIFGLGMRGIKNQSLKEFADLPDALKDFYEAGSEYTRLELDNKKLSFAEKFSRVSGMGLKLATATYDLKNDSGKMESHKTTNSELFSTPQEASPNLRASIELNYYGKKFKGIKSSDGNNVYLDNPDDVKEICTLATKERLKERFYDSFTINKMLENANSATAFFDSRSKLMFAPRISLLNDTDKRQIASGILHHEQTHRNNDLQHITGNKDELSALQSQRDLYAKRGISFYFKDGELVTEKATGEIQSASDFELQEYARENSILEEIGLHLVSRNKKKLKLSPQQATALKTFFDNLEKTENNTLRHDYFAKLSSQLNKINLPFDLNTLVNELFEIALNNNESERRTKLTREWGISENQINIAENWLKTILKNNENINLIRAKLGLNFDHKRLNRLLLIIRYEQVEKELADLLTNKRTNEIQQSTLDQIADLYEVPCIDGKPKCPASFKINMQLGGFTDLSPHEFPDIAKHINIDNLLDADCLKLLGTWGQQDGELARTALLDLIWHDIKARLAATKIKHLQARSNNETISLWNDLSLPRDNWKEGELEQLLKSLEEKGIFVQEITDERFGIPRTSDTRNIDMHARKWTTDACIGGGLSQREVKSKSHFWARNLITNAGFMLHPSNLNAMHESLRDPEWYRQGDASKGISHIFLSEPKNSQGEGLQWDEENQVPTVDSIVPDPAWFNCKRLESQALLLYSLVETLIAGACHGERNSNLAQRGKHWGFKWSGENSLTEKQKEYIISSIQVISSYILSVQWDGNSYDMKAPTVSAWEEAPLYGGCASDTGFMKDSINLLHDLLFNKEFSNNETIKDIRQRLSKIDSPLLREKLSDEILATSTFADFRIERNLMAFIDSAKNLLSQRVIAPITSAIDGTSVSTPTGVKQFESRGPDTSLAILAAYHWRFDRSLARDARIRYGLVVAAKDQLMNAHPDNRFGMRRYSPFWDPETESWIMDSYMMREFDLGLIAPGLVRPQYANKIAIEHGKISPYMEERVSRESASPRDLLVAEAHRAFNENTGQQVEAKKDATTTSAMVGRQQFGLPEWVAQWTIGPTAAVMALAKAKLELLEYLSNQQYENEQPVLDLLAMVNKELNFFINISLSTIVKNKDKNGRTVLRADGTELPAEYNTMEAFVVVPDVEGNDVWMPGAHTLTWSNAQFHYGLQLATLAARRESNMRLQTSNP